ncbi:MAG: helix-turn-helix domain-containing protein [Desulfobulbia bacterium]
MGHAISAEELLDEIKMMPVAERSRFFTLLGAQLFQAENFSHDQVFGHLANELFTAQEAAEYLEVSIATFRRYVRNGKLTPAQWVGRSQMFATRNLKNFKRSLREVRQGR